MKGNRAHHLSRGERRLRSESEPVVRSSGNPTMAFISGMGLGAGIMYVLDPDRGNRRRAMAQQKAFRLLRQAGDALDKSVRDLEHRTEGILAGALSFLRREQVPDDVLAERVRSKLGRVACHPGSIEVRAHDGELVLSGPVLRGETGEIVAAIRKVRGVRGLECRLEEHDSSENVPGLQGRAVRPGDKPDLLQENWAPGTRLLMGGIGVSLLARGVRRPGVLNSLAGIVGLGLLARAARHSRVLDTFMDALRPMPGPRAGHSAATRGRRIEAGLRTAGLGRRDEVGRSGVYPMSGPLPPGPAEIRGQASWGQGERGAAGYEDHGASEMTYTGGQVLGALSGGAPVDINEILRAREIPRDQWLNFFNQLSTSLTGCPVTVQIRDGGKTRTEQSGLPLDGIGADLKDRESIVNVTVGREAHNQVTHSIRAKRVAVRDSGENKFVEIESEDGPTTAVRFRAADLRGLAA